MSARGALWRLKLRWYFWRRRHWYAWLGKRWGCVGFCDVCGIPITGEAYNLGEQAEHSCYRCARACEDVET